MAAWRSKLKAPRSKGKQVKFIEVQGPTAVAESPEPAVIELVFGGTRILLRGRVEADALTAVLAALEGRR